MIHNYPKIQAGFKPIQNLFDNNIDFDNKAVPDNINGYNASLKYEYTMASSAVNSNILNLPDNFVNLNSDWTIIMDLSMDRSGLLFKIFYNSQISWNTFFADELIPIINGVQVTSFSWNNGHLRTPYEGSRKLLVFKKTGNQYKTFKEGVLQNTFTNSFVFTDNTFKSTYTSMFNFGAIASLSIALDDSIINSWGNNTKLMLDYVLLNTSNVNYLFPCSEGTGNTFFDRIQGTEINWNLNISWINYYIGFVPNPYIPVLKKNLKYGFDLYTLDSNPTTKLYVPLKYDGTSFGKVLAGYTFVGTYTQSGNQFLPCETKLVQPNVAILKAADKNNFYFNVSGTPLEKTAAEITAQVNAYITYELVDSKINNLKLLE